MASGRSAKYNNSFIFIHVPKVRCTFNNMSPFPGEGGEGDGVLRGCKSPLR